jgi:predicted TIM-barrel fold metal-dependent hydrolase
MAKLQFFDCNCSVGRTGYPHLLDIPDAPGLKQEMKIAGIEEALVYHILARDGSPSLGNSLLLDEINEVEELHPVWVVIPHHTGEMPPPERLLQDMKKRGVKAVRIYPTRTHHGFAIEEWCAGELFSALEKPRIPLILDIEIATWKDVQILLRNHPLLPLIIANCSYRHNRFLYPLLEKHDNLHIETSRFMGAGAIEDMVKRFGAHPLLFGTNMPQYTGTAAVALLTYADIEAKEKEAIAGENLRRIFQEIWP